MKKVIALALTAVMLFALAGCGAKPTVDENVGGAATQQAVTDEEKQVIMEVLGFSEEEFAAIRREQQRALADEAGAVQQQQQQQAQQQETVKTYTPDDVMAGGKYKVVLGDYMNSITLYYEDGKLVKLVETFQKNSEEEIEEYVAEGDALAEYTFNFIDWANAPLQDILDGMKDYGSFGQYKIVAVE